MVEKYVTADLTDTALLIECAECRSAYTLRPNTSHEGLWREGAIQCFACGQQLAQETEQVASLYRRLCKDADALCKDADASKSGARIRVRVPAA